MGYIVSVGFALWIEGDLAWAQGLHEYRPMGVAVVAVTDRFQPRDFRPSRPAPRRDERTYAGLFASLGELNSSLERLRRSQRQRKKSQRGRSVTPAWI